METLPTCDDVRGCFPLYVGGDLEEPLVRQVLEHVHGREHQAGCGKCAAELASAEHARRALLALPSEAPEDLDLWQDLHLRLRSEGILGARPHAAPARRRTWRRLAGYPGYIGAAAAAAVLGIGVWFSDAAAPISPGAGDAAPPSATVAGRAEPGVTSLAQALRDRAAARPAGGATAPSSALRRPVAGPRTALPFNATVSWTPSSRLAAPGARSFSRRTSGARVLPVASSLASGAAAQASSGSAFPGSPSLGDPALGGLRRATRQDELLRHTALPWRQHFYRTPNVPIYWGENATVGYGLR